jgi:excisionase family DNA binding protein
MSNQNAKLAYTISELPKLTGVGRSRLYQAISSGTLVAKKLGRRTIVLSSDLERFLNTLPCVTNRTSEKD